MTVFVLLFAVAAALYIALRVKLKKKAAAVAAAFEKMAVPYAKVRRGGRLLIVPAEDLVQGDHVLLEAGDLVPADIRLTKTEELKAREYFLTGAPTEKSKDALREDWVFLSGLITHGRGEGIARHIGSDTQLYFAAKALAEEARVKNPFKMPAALKRLDAAKQMIIERTEKPFSTALKVTAAAAPFTVVSPASYLRQPNALFMSTAMALCNDGERGDFDGKAVFFGEPDETALLYFVLPMGYERERMERTMHRMQAHFDGGMTTVHKDGRGFRSFKKGDAETVLAMCTHLSDGAVRPMEEEDRAKIQDAAAHMRRSARQVIAFAMGDENMETGFVFLGLISLNDA